MCATSNLSLLQLLEFTPTSSWCAGTLEGGVLITASAVPPEGLASPNYPPSKITQGAIE